MSKSSDEPFQRIEVITSVQRRRRWSVAEKVRLVEEAMQPGMSVSYVARKSPPRTLRDLDAAALKLRNATAVLRRYRRKNPRFLQDFRA